MSADTLLHGIADRFDKSFADEVPWRQLGRESEYPIVDASGEPAPLSDLWDELRGAHPHMVDLREGDLIVGLECPDFIYSAEVGISTIEVIAPPCPDLVQLESWCQRAEAPVLRACESRGWKLLGYGIQPKSNPVRALLTPKQRYGVLLDIIGDGWLSFAVTASDQVQMDVSRSEWVAVSNLGNLLTPIVVALCANSPVSGNALTGFSCTREAWMGRIDAAGHRHGMTAGPWANATELVQRFTDLDVMLERTADQQVRRGTNTFRELVGQCVDLDAAWQAFLLHEHYAWNSARPRSAHGTVEFRSACQQPPGESLAATALSLAIVEARPALEAILSRHLGDQAWPVMAKWHGEVIRDGLAAPEPSPGLTLDVLNACAQALEARGRGEVRFLQPLFDRLSAKQNPAQRAAKRFSAAGLAGLIELVALR